jgi:hypothetical protein
MMMAIVVVAAATYGQPVSAATGVTGTTAMVPSYELTFSIPANNLYTFSLAVDRVGNVYSGLLDDNVIKKYDSNGNYLMEWGSYGTGSGQFDGVRELGTDGRGYIYVSDGNNRIQKFTNDGSYVSEWGTSGAADGQFGAIGEMAIDTGGNFYITDSMRNTIQKLDSNGTFISKWGTAGSGDGQFNNIGKLAIDSHNNVYVADAFNICR